ncbi:unnamed protein product [Ectocarpus fasciculatus]
MESQAKGFRASRLPTTGARRHQQATPKSGGKPFRPPSAVRKARALHDADGFSGPVVPAPGSRGQAGTSAASLTAASSGVTAGEGVMKTVPPAAGGGTAALRAGVDGDDGSDVAKVSREEQTKAPSLATTSGGRGGDGGGVRGFVETLTKAVDDDADAGAASAGVDGVGSFTGATTTTPQTSGRQPQTRRRKESTDIQSLEDVGPAVAPGGAAEAPPPPTAAAPSGFITGGGRPVHVSAEALLKAKRLLADASGDDDIESAAGAERGDQEGATAARPGASPVLAQSTTIRASAQGRTILASGTGMPDARQGGNGWQGSAGGDTKPSAVGGGSGGGGSAGGFSTGSGRRVEVSPEALERARQMFAECEAATPSGSGGRGGDENPPPATGGSDAGGGVGGSGIGGGGIGGVVGGPGGGGTEGGVFSTGRGKLATAALPSLRPDGLRVPCSRLPPPLPPQ